MVDVADDRRRARGLSAAINARARGKGVLVVGNPIEENPLYKAPVIDNYPGLPGISGAQLLHTLEAHTRESGAQFRSGRVLSAMPMGDRFFLSIGSEVEEARSLVVAISAQRGAKLPGEEALLGRGVSWCATCDGMLYRNKAVAVVGLSHDAPAEANFLQEIGCQVTYVARKAPQGLRPDIPVVLGRRLSVEGEQSVTAVRAGRDRRPLSGRVHSAGGHGPRRPAARSGAGGRLHLRGPLHGYQSPRCVCLRRLHRTAFAGCQGGGRRSGGRTERRRLCGPSGTLVCTMFCGRRISGRQNGIYKN